MLLANPFEKPRHNHILSEQLTAHLFPSICGGRARLLEDEVERPRQLVLVRRDHHLEDGVPDRFESNEQS